MSVPTDERLRKAVERAKDIKVFAPVHERVDIILPAEFQPSIQDAINAADFAAWIIEARKVLREYEWMGYDEELGEYCFTCHIPKKRGHAPDCALDKLLPK